MKIEVTSVRSVNSGSEFSIGVRLSNGENTELREFVLLSSQYTELGIRKGEITSDMFDSVSAAADICAAVRKGMYMISCGACSAKRLALRLRTKGFSRETADAAVSYISSRGFLNEEDDAEREAEKCIAKLWGKRRIISELYAKGYSDAAIRYVSAGLEDTDFAENCRKLAGRSCRGGIQDASAKKKLISSLMRMGYTYGEINEAIRSLQ